MAPNRNTGDDAMAIWENCPAVERRPDIVSGAWVFRGTRVAVAALFENLRDGASVQEFLAWFPGVQQSQVEAVLDAEAEAARGDRGRLPLGPAGAGVLTRP